MLAFAYKWSSRILALLRPNAAGVKGIVRTDDGRALLVRHSYVRGWHLPGGGVKRGESPEDAVRRELLEETGVVVGDGRDALHVLGRYTGRLNGRPDRLTVFVVARWQQQVAANLEISEARFVPTHRLPAGTTRATRRRLAELAGDREITPEW